MTNFEFSDFKNLSNFFELLKIYPVKFVILQDAMGAAVKILLDSTNFTKIGDVEFEINANFANVFEYVKIIS